MVADGTKAVSFWRGSSNARRHKGRAPGEIAAPQRSPSELLPCASRAPRPHRGRVGSALLVLSGTCRASLLLLLSGATRALAEHAFLPDRVGTSALAAGLHVFVNAG